MKRVAIVTLNGYHNYGNRLQNYATQEVLKSLGCLAETIIINNQSEKKQLASLANKLNNVSLYKIYFKILTYMNKNIITKRTKAFKSFTKQYILEKNYGYSQNDLHNGIFDSFDYFIAGSDQVWNPIYINKLPWYFLTFVPQHKRIAYAPSFGIPEIPFEYKKDYKIWLLEMANLSVREETGVKIIKDLTGRDAILLVDPTLMLTKEKWLSIAKESISKPKNKYLLTYFLGDVLRKDRKTINIIAKRNNLQIVNLADIRDRQAYVTGPSEFIDYINSASAFFTDSFHGVIFSILMETPFVVYERISKSVSMYSRIETLLDKFNLRSREACNIKSSEQVFETDFSHIKPILELERKKSIDYLKEAFNIG